jgi:hypothetical protein
MEPTAARLMTERIRDIERQAASHGPLQFDDGTRAERPAWRRRGGAAARRLSLALADLATELDPALCRPSYGRE